MQETNSFINPLATVPKDSLASSFASCLCTFASLAFELQAEVHFVL